MWKRFRGFKRPLNMMSWTGSSTMWDCLIWCPLGRKRCTPLCCLLWLLGGGKRREGECYLISLNITLHRVQLHHKKSRKETSWSWTRERTFKRKGLRKRIKSVPCSLICKKMFSVMKDCGYFCWWEQLPRFLLVILRPLTCVRTTNK